MPRVLEFAEQAPMPWLRSPMIFWSAGNRRKVADEIRKGVSESRKTGQVITHVQLPGWDGAVAVAEVLDALHA